MSPRPRLLFLSPRFPWPLDRGDRLRCYHLIRAFAPHADITLLSLSPDAAHEAPIEPLLDLCRRVEVVTLPTWQSKLQMLEAVARGGPFQVAYFRSEAMERVVDRLARERFDLAFGYMFRVFPYLERLNATPRYLDLQDALALTYRRAAPLKRGVARLAFQEEWRRVEAYEPRVLDGLREAWVVSELDRQDLLRRRPEARIQVVPNGVEQRWGDAGLGGPKEPAVLFLGNLTAGHNVDAVSHFVRHVWPLVRRGHPDATLELVGEANATIAALGGGEGVNVHGYIPDLAPVLVRCRLSVAPIRYAAGIQNKVLETMAAGLPVVASGLAALPIGAEPGHEIAVADDPIEQAQEILALLKDPHRARELSLAGQAYVRRHFSWARAGESFREILATL